MKDFTALVAYVESERDSLFGFGAATLIPYLPFGLAQPYLKDEVTPEQWEPAPYSRESILTEMATYMEFAWEKALDERGLSAMRSIQRFAAWLYALDDQDTLAFVQNDDNYPMYGKPMLRKICEVYQLPLPVGV